MFLWFGGYYHSTGKESVWLRAVGWAQGPYLAISFLLTDMQSVQGTPCKREGAVKDLTMGPFRAYSLSGSINDVNESITS